MRIFGKAVYQYMRKNSKTQTFINIYMFFLENIYLGNRDKVPDRQRFILVKLKTFLTTTRTVWTLRHAQFHFT